MSDLADIKMAMAAKTNVKAALQKLEQIELGKFKFYRVEAKLIQFLLNQLREAETQLKKISPLLDKLDVEDKLDRLNTKNKKFWKGKGEARVSSVQRRKLIEGTATVTDDQLSSLWHHVQDAKNAKDKSRLLGALEDILGLTKAMMSGLDSDERREISTMIKNKAR